MPGFTDPRSLSDLIVILYESGQHLMSENLTVALYQPCALPSLTTADRSAKRVMLEAGQNIKAVSGFDGVETPSLTASRRGRLTGRRVMCGLGGRRGGFDGF